ncbi:MAG: hypothetical protein R3C03_13870 [Pirellulaceae bacterium]
MFKLKEHVLVYSNSSKSNVLCEIKADRIIDWSASYHFFDSNQESFGCVKRKGMRSIFKAHYDVFDENDQPLAQIKEENPMAKIGDAMLGEIPVLGVLSGYLFNPKYLLTSTSGQPLMRLSKKPAFLEGKFQVDKLADFDEVDELTYLMSFMMMCLLERMRG